MIHQQLRWPDGIEQWQREANERAEQESLRDRLSHPALWAKMCELEAKLDRIIKILAE